MAGLSDVLIGLGRGAAGTLKRRRARREEQEDKLGQIIASARASEEAKSEFDPERQAVAELLGLTRSLRQFEEPTEPQFGLDRIGPPTREAAEGAQARTFGRAQIQNRIEDLLKSGIVRQPQPTVTQLFTVDESGTPKPGGVIPRGGKIVTPPKTEATIEEEAAARARGTRKGRGLTPQQEAFVNNYGSLYRSASNALSMIQQDPAALARTGVPFAPASANLRTELDNAADVLLRLRSGAQINEKEYGRLRRLLPTAMDFFVERVGNPGHVAFKLTRFIQESETILKSRGLSVDSLSGGEVGEDEEAGSLVDRALAGDEAAEQRLRELGVL